MKPDTINPSIALAKTMEICFQKHLSLCVAESITGGRLSAAFTALPGSSKVLVEGLVCYTPASKIARLHINPEIITLYGLVSQEITLLMAKQIRKIMKSDIGIATTGNAGPEPNDSLAGVGQTFFALCSKTREIIIPRMYSGNRSQIQSRLTEDVIRSLYIFLSEGEL